MAAVLWAMAPAIMPARLRSFLTGVHPVKTAGADIKVGVSVDQMAAQAVGNADQVSLARTHLRRRPPGRQLRFRL